MTIERKNPYGPLDPLALERFERELSPLHLPVEFRDFVIEFNGAHFPDSGEFGDLGGTDVGDIFGLHSGPEYLRLDLAWSDFREFVPRPLLTFAADPYGNYYAMSLDGQNCGAIYFVDHEDLPTRVDEMPRVASSFSAFLKHAGSELAPPEEYADLTRAIHSGDHDAVRVFLKRGASPIGQVHHAVHRGDLALLELILNAGGSPDEEGGIGASETPLFVAARTGRADMASLLIGHGADVNHRCSAGGNALAMALPYADVFAVLARAGAEPPTPRQRGMVQSALDPE